MRDPRRMTTMEQLRDALRRNDLAGIRRAAAVMVLDEGSQVEMVGWSSTGMQVGSVYIPDGLLSWTARSARGFAADVAELARDLHFTSGSQSQHRRNIDLRIRAARQAVIGATPHMELGITLSGDLGIYMLDDPQAEACHCAYVAALPYGARDAWEVVVSPIDAPELATRATKRAIKANVPHLEVGRVAALWLLDS